MNQAISKDYPIEIVISMVTGRYLINDFNAMMNAIAFVANNDEVWVHTVPEFMKQIDPYLHDWYPWMLEIDFSDWAFPKQGADESNPNFWTHKLDALRAEHGAELPLWQIPADDQEAIDPFDAAEKLVGKDRIFGIALSDDDEDDTLSAYGTIDWKD